MLPFHSELYHPDGAVYTIRLGTLIDDGWDIGLDDYPIFKDEYRPLLNATIIDQFYFREIGFEVEELFKRMINRKMRLQMPYFNQLYLTQLKEFDPMRSVDMHTDTSGDATNTTARIEDSKASTVSDTEADASGRARNLTSDTPVTQLSGREDYATGLADAMSEQKSVSKVNGSTDGRTSSNDNTTALTKSLSHTYGYTSDPNALLAAWRDNILNVDAAVIEMLDPCFMQIYRSDYGTL